MEELREMSKSKERAQSKTKQEYQHKIEDSAWWPHLEVQDPDSINLLMDKTYPTLT